MSEKSGAAPPQITGYHAHVYFDADTREPARRLRQRVEELFDIQMGRWHEKTVGPHPRWSYQIAFEPDLFKDLIPWLMLNREGCQIFIHPNTEDAVADHRDWPIWMGDISEIDVGFLERMQAKADAKVGD